ncbi:MAG TPA: NADP-dependent phosphogluconate dehydrogenase [Candidatus Saccharimonadales bacterium]|nr:NADP-dependent phosphogluconate dehydrogenase [Candidatus Saccharimonadales bacterium]
MKITIVGLGKMGSQIAERLVKAGHQVVAVDPDPAAVKAAEAFGAVGVANRAAAVQEFAGEPAVVWLMIPAQFVTEEVAAWLEVLPAGSLLVDGGNTDFRETKKHAAACAGRSVNFVDVGVSGGVMGLINGFSMMAGGDEASYQRITPVLDALSMPNGGHDYFGEAGSGHYVKMVHNAIEYGMMQSLAEGYQILKQGPYSNLDLAKAGAVWQKASVIESTLNSLMAEVMIENPNQDGISGYVAESGEARWTLEVAKDTGIELPVIKTALGVRIRSEQGDVSYATKLLASLRNKFGGHKVNK